ncbi:hypothetical protein [Xanthobacter versatilis]|uniref:hypothetical protein n=1 Tax=Xanthobacter autotrophicus (strain ATCC BAA-1158 / Py2) TaxID=78245 RepID=UPI00372842EB
MAQLFATDKEIYDLIMASSRRLSANALVELLQDRRIFIGADGRSKLADMLATLPHDYHDVVGLVAKGEMARRAERTTSVRIPGSISLADLRAALASYVTDVAGREEVHTQSATAHRLMVHIEYDEVEYSRTSLIQKQRKSSDFDFHIDENLVTVRFPASEKAREIISQVTSKLSELKRQNYIPEGITVSHITTPAGRSDFFLKLMRSIEGFRFLTVTDVRVGRFSEGGGVDALDGEEATDQSIGGRSEQLISYIQSVSMRGENLVMTQEFQRLMAGGFFVTALTWDADRIGEPRDLMRFDVSFEEGVAGTGLRYALRHKTRRDNGNLVATFHPVPDIHRPGLFGAIESAARRVLLEMEAQRAPRSESDRAERDPADAEARP